MRLLLCSAAVLLLNLSIAARDFHVDPASGKPGNDGSAAKPWRTLKEVVSQGHLARVKGGDTVLLKDGYHGCVSFGGSPDKVVTIRAADGAKPTLGALTFKKGKNWIIKGLTVSPSFRTAAEKSGKKSRVKNIVTVAEGGPTENLVIEDCFIYDSLDTKGWDAKRWMGASSGMFMGRHGRKVTFRNNYILNTRFAMSLCSFDSVAEGNVIENFSADGIRMTRDGLTAQHNVIRNIYVSSKDGDKNHDDAIQCFLFNKGRGLIRNFTIRENLVFMRENEQQKFPAVMQAIGIFDGPLEKFVVEGNVINTHHWHGVSLYDATDCTIRNNVVYSQWQSKMKPWVMLGTKKRGGNKNNIVENNYAYTFRLGKNGASRKKNNQKITKEIWLKRQAELLAKIEKQYGEKHPVSGRTRVKK